MNRYGRFAQEMWQQLAPRAYSEIPDPSSHFSMIGEEAETRIFQIASQLEGDDPPSETFWEKVARLETAKRTAEEIVREEMLIPAPESREINEEDEDPPSENLARILDIYRIDQEAMLEDQYE